MSKQLLYRFSFVKEMLRSLHSEDLDGGLWKTENFCGQHFRAKVVHHGEQQKQ